MTDATNTKVAKCVKTYITQDGKRLSRSADTIVGVEFAFNDTDPAVVVFATAPTTEALGALKTGAVVRVPGDFPASYQSAMAVRGWAENCGNSYSGSKTVADARGKFNAYLGNLLDGAWGEPREAEPSGLLLDACVAWAVAQGKTEDGARAHFTGLLFAKGDDGKLTPAAVAFRKNVRKDVPGIDAQYQRLQLERAKAAVKEADAKAKGDSAGADLLAAVA